MGRGVLLIICMVAAVSIDTISSFAQEGVEVRAAQVCAGIGQIAGNLQGSVDVGNLNVQGIGNGTVIVRRNGADLGKIERGSYKDYTTCLIEVIKLISAPPPPPPFCQEQKVIGWL